jgi:hypothetical protein
MIANLVKIPTKIGQFLLHPKTLLILSVLVLLTGYFYRIILILLSPTGGDDGTHIEAIQNFLSGVNPYEQTVSSYSHLEEAPSSKGYAYFPAILYVYTILYKISLLFPKNPELMGVFFRLPGVLANLGVGLFLLQYFYKKNKLAMFYSVTFWTFNYFLLARNSLARFDALPVFFLLLALNQQEKNDIKAGIFFSISVLFKTFPVILFPLFMFKSKKPLVFLGIGLLTALLFSFPFITNLTDISTYIQGTLLVHSERFIQGRPFLYYLSYLIHIEFFRVIPFWFYSLGSIVFGWVALCLNRIFNIIKNKYVASLFPFFIFYLLTPVLNRSFLLWWIPVFLIGTFEGLQKKHLPLFYFITAIFWGLFYWYLAQWDNGFHDGLIMY